MTYAGAKGSTAEQMAAALHFGLPADQVPAAYGAWLKQLNAGDAADSEKRAYVLAVANALWGQHGYPWAADYLKLTKEYFGAGLSDVDFARDPEAARKVINAWVEKQTRDYIKDLIGEGVLTTNTRLVLTNAVYFQGNWQQPFNPKMTIQRPFYGPTEVKADMMHQKGSYNYFENDALQALELPYQGGDVSMVVLLPKKRDGLADLEKSFSADRLADWLGKLKPTDDVRLALPKFTTTAGFELSAVLKKLGMTDAFDGAKADFSGLNGGSEKLAISKVIHKAFVQVDEVGTKAAAATAVVFERAALAVNAPTFTADHPFVFVIRDTKTGGILFMGRIVDPTK
jgi:serpin B